MNVWTKLRNWFYVYICCRPEYDEHIMSPRHPQLYYSDFDYSKLKDNPIVVTV